MRPHVRPIETWTSRWTNGDVPLETRAGRGLKSLTPLALDVRPAPGSARVETRETRGTFGVLWPCSRVLAKGAQGRPMMAASPDTEPLGA